MIIRDRRESDIEPLAAVAREVRQLDNYPPFLPDRDYERFITRPAALAAWVAEVDGAVCGHVAVNTSSHGAVMEVVRAAGLADTDIAVVARLFVAPAVRGRGVGAALLQRATRWIVDRGQVPILDVVTQQTAAIRLYETTGWTVIGRTSFAPPGAGPIEELVMRFNIGAGAR